MDSEQHERAKKAIGFIFEKAGYEVCSEEGQFDLSASITGRFIVILCSDDKNAITRFHETVFRIEDESSPCTRLVFTLMPDISLFETIVIGPDEFCDLAGKAMLSGVTGQEFSLDTIFSFEQEEPGALREALLASLPIKVTSEKALHLAGIKGEIRLRMMPYWSYHYSCDGEKRFKDKTVSFTCESEGSLNGINGVLSGLSSDPIKPLKIPPSAEIVNPKIIEEDAKKRVLTKAIQDLTRHVRLKQESGQTIAYEDKVLSPDYDFFETRFSLFYIPVWQVRGKRIVEINATSGEILSEPMDEGVEVF